MYNEVFAGCTNLQSAVIGTNLSLLRDRVFAGCSSLKSVLFKGNKPSPGDPDPDGIPTYNDLFLDSQPTVYYLPGTTGWGAAFVGRPAILWDAQLIVADPNFGVSAGRFGFKMTGSDGLALVVEASDDLNSGLWTAISTNVLQGGAALFKDSEPATRTARVYRFRSQ
jgi:hypothetical protein